MKILRKIQLYIPKFVLELQLRRRFQHFLVSFRFKYMFGQDSESLLGLTIEHGLRIQHFLRFLHSKTTNCKAKLATNHPEYFSETFLNYFKRKMIKTRLKFSVFVLRLDESRRRSDLRSSTSACNFEHFYSPRYEYFT